MSRKTIKYRRKVKRSKDGKKYKYPNSWSNSRKLKITPKDMSRIKMLGNTQWEYDPISDRMVYDAIREFPPRKNRDLVDSRGSPRGNVLSVIATSTKYGLSHDDLLALMKVNGIDNPEQYVKTLVKDGFVYRKRKDDTYHIKKSKKKPKMLKDYIYQFKMKQGLEGDIIGLTYDVNELTAKDYQYFVNNYYTMKPIGNDILFSRVGWDSKTIPAYVMSQQHDQAVSSDNLRPRVMFSFQSLREPVLVLSDLKGNGVMIKRMTIDKREAIASIEGLKFGRYLSHNVPDDARIVQEGGEQFLVESLIPDTVPWTRVKRSTKEVLKKTSAKATGRRAVFYGITDMSDRHPYNILVKNPDSKNPELFDIDFGQSSWSGDRQSTDPTLSEETRAVGARIRDFKPKSINKEQYKQYKLGEQESVDRVTKLVMSGQVDRKFKYTDNMKVVAKRRKRGQTKKLEFGKETARIWDGTEYTEA